MAHVADCGDLPDPLPGGGGDGRHHEVLLHELGRRQSPAGAGIARQVKGAESFILFLSMIRSTTQLFI